MPRAQLSSPRASSRVLSGLCPSPAPSLNLVGQTTSVDPKTANEAQKQMTILREHLERIESEDEEPVNQCARKGKREDRFLSDDETSLLEAKQEPAQLFISIDSIDIGGEMPDEQDDFLAIDKPQDMHDNFRQTRATVGVGSELREHEGKKDYSVKPAAKKCLPESGSQCPTSVPTPDLTSATLNFGFENGSLAPAKLLASSYRLLTAASNVEQWGSTDNEQLSDGSPQLLARSPAAWHGGEGGVAGLQ